MDADRSILINGTYQVPVYFFGEVRRERRQQLGDVTRHCKGYYKPTVYRYRFHSSRNAGGCGAHTSWITFDKVLDLSAGPGRIVVFQGRNLHPESTDSARKVSTGQAPVLPPLVFLGRVCSYRYWHTSRRKNTRSTASAGSAV